MGRKWVVLSALALVLAVAAGVVALRAVRARPKPVAVAPAPLPVASPAGLVVLSGRVRAQETVNVPAGVTGNVDMFYADVGHEVAEGQLLARLSCLGLETAREVATTALDTAQARVSKIEAALLTARMEASRAEADAARTRSEVEQADRTFQRQRMLHGEGATPRVVYEKAGRDREAAQTGHAVAELTAKQAAQQVSALVEQADGARKILADRASQLEDAQAALSAGEVIAPVDGLVVARAGEVGKLTGGPDEVLFQIAVHPTQLRVEIEPEPPVLARVRPGLEALVVVPEMATGGIPGVVKAIEGTIVLVDFTSPRPEIHPGMQAEVRLLIK
jgi:macrolide-specific efflux system membrane fusion protein